MRPASGGRHDCREGQDGTGEAGVWIGRSHRGAGVGAAVLQLLLDQARAKGCDQVYVSTHRRTARCGL
ncbi:GNAT family N-acetyltransferase [Streptomyces sp. NBC_00199]|uniref:GNAT family N-acetyltransferase n=1 Tax=Streptomyces sp. NBC_00199 TaxID=2975678 RepID=UPI0033905228